MKKSDNNFLYVDTALLSYQITYVENNKIVFESLSENISGGHAQAFFQNIAKLSKSYPHWLDNLSKIIVNIGPGRFNALRVGLGFALTCCSLHNIKLYQVNSFDIIKQSICKKNQSTCDLAIFAKWNHVYLLRKDAKNPSIAPFDDLNWKNTVCLGIANDNCLQQLDKLQVKNFTELLTHSHQVKDLSTLEPLYLGHQIEVKNT